MKTKMLIKTATNYSWENFMSGVESVLFPRQNIRIIRINTPRVESSIGMAWKEVGDTIKRVYEQERLQK